MPITERHHSPDGLFELVVDLTRGDWTVGFAGHAWHTHGDILEAWGYAGSPEVTTRAFVDDVIASRRVIAVYRTNGVIHDVAVPDDLVERPLGRSFARHAAAGETMELRYWNGQAARD